MVDCWLWTQNNGTILRHTRIRITEKTLEEDELRSTMMISHLFSAYEVEGAEQLTAVLVPSTNREPGQTWGGVHGGLAHAPAHELISTLNI